MTRRRWLALASLLGLAGLVVFFAWPSERPLPGLDSDAPRFSWPQGLVRQYRLLAEGSSVVPSPDDGKPMSGVASTEATLELRGYGVHDGRVVLGLRLTKLLTAKMTLFGQPAMQDRAALEAALVGPEAFLSFLPTGDLVQVRFERDVNNTFKGLAELVAGELQAPLRKGASYTLIETTTRGRAKTVFTAGDGSLTKQRVRYVSLSGFGKGAVDLQLEGLTSLTLSPEGQPLRVTTHERLFTAQSSSVQDLTLIAEGEARFAGALPTQPLVEAKLDELTVPADAREQILSQRIAGLTEAELFASVEAYGLAGTLPDLGLFMGRATGLLIKHPELCARLAERNLKNEPFYARHQFHFDYQYYLQIVIIILFFIAAILVFFLPKNVFYFGIILSLIILFYFFYLQKTPKTGNYLYFKEIFTAAIYSICIIGSAFTTKSNLDFFDYLIGFNFFLLVHQSILMFSFYEVNEKSDVKNLAKKLGEKYCTFSIIGVAVFIVLCNFFVSNTFIHKVLIIESLMAFCTILIFVFQVKLSKNQHYRWLGEMVFWLPLLLIFF